MEAEKPLKNTHISLGFFEIKRRGVLRGFGRSSSSNMSFDEYGE